MAARQAVQVVARRRRFAQGGRPRNPPYSEENLACLIFLGCGVDTAARRAGHLGDLAMRAIGVLVIFAASPLLLGAGPPSRILALYPENAKAQAVGPLNAFIKGKYGNGAISLKMPAGELLEGRFEVKVGASDGAHSPAVANMRGPSGITVHCEVMNDRANTQGSGVCHFSDGAEYRVAY
jgi:hypothetical protein